MSLYKFNSSWRKFESLEFGSNPPFNVIREIHKKCLIKNVLVLKLRKRYWGGRYYRKPVLTMRSRIAFPTQWLKTVRLVSQFLNLLILKNFKIMKFLIVLHFNFIYLMKFNNQRTTKINHNQNFKGAALAVRLVISLKTPLSHSYVFAFSPSLGFISFLAIRCRNRRIKIVFFQN